MLLISNIKSARKVGAVTIVGVLEQMLDTSVHAEQLSKLGAHCGGDLLQFLFFIWLFQQERSQPCSTHSCTSPSNRAATLHAVEAD